MKELIDLQYNLDEISKDVWDLNAGQDQLSKRLDRLEQAVQHLAKHIGSSPAAAGAYVTDVLLAP